MTDYLALVGRGTEDYKNVFKPDSPSLGVDGKNVVMSGFTGSTPRLQWRIWIPPGTKSLQATLYTYASPPESKVLLRMHQPPVGTVNNVTPENAAAVDMANVLALLMTGAEVPAYTPSGAGAVKLSDGRMDSPVVTTSGAWLYINALQTPGAQIFQLDARLTVDKAQYQTWYEHAVWDDQGNPIEGPPVVQPIESHEERVLRLLKEAELVAPLMALAGVATDIELGKKALATGVWAGLLRLIK